LITTFLEEPFIKWGLDFIGPIELGGRLIANKYVVIWVKAKALKTNIAVIIVIFMYECI
jgi:hypothetical protein